MDLIKLQNNTIPTIQSWLTKQDLYYHNKWNKSQLLDRVKEFLAYQANPAKFDKIDKVVLLHFSRCVEPMLVIRFANTCRRLRSLLNTNFIWQRICQTLPRYTDIHELDLQRIQPEGFWRDWFLQNCRRCVKRSPSYYSNREIRGNTVIATIYPAVGSILVDRLLIAHPKFVCVEAVLFSRGANRNLPKVIKIAPLVAQNSDWTLFYYHQIETMTMKIGESGEVDNRYTVVVPEAYNRADLGLQ